MGISGLKIRNDAIVHENEERKVFGVFNEDKNDKNSFLAKNERAFVLKKDGWIGDHYREYFEDDSLLEGEVHWFFEDMKTGQREDHIIKAGTKVMVPPNVCQVLKAKKGAILLGRYCKTFEELKTNKHMMEWARKI